jgi:FKBP-type peptidyl-prolyl cis-trans isomerase
MKVIFPVALVGIFILTFLSSCIEQKTDPQFSFQEQWKKDTTAIGAHLRANNIMTMTDASGVRFVIDSLAEGFTAKTGSTVSFKYTGKFLSGTVFDQGSTNSALVSNFIDGFQIALSLLPEGSKGRFYIPSGYAYGESGTGSIPGNTNLMFEIQLTDLVITETEKMKLASDTVAIDDYLAKNSITAIRDKSGLRYVITQMGTGVKPALYTKVKINYTGKLLDGTVFFNGSGEPSSEFDSRVINYFYAFQAGLPKLPVGSKATFYIPSGLGFGTQTLTSGSITIPANSNIAYDIELLGIEN